MERPRPSAWALALALALPAASCRDGDCRISAVELRRAMEASGERVERVPVALHERARRVLCAHYDAPGCVPGTGKRIRARLVEFLAIQFETEPQARAAAAKYGQYHKCNWLFDEAAGEPVIEHFLRTRLGATAHSSGNAR